MYELPISLIIKTLGLEESAREIGEKGIQWISDVIKFRPQRRNLWQIVEPEELVIVASTSALIYTGKYDRPVTGVGQLRALAYAAESLVKTYGALDLNRVYLSKDPSLDYSNRDLLLLGSPKTNTISRDFLNGIVDDQPAIQEGSVIRWRKWDGSSWTLKGVPRLVGKAEGEEIVSDYGLIIRVRNASKNDRTVILFSGSHTYGTVAAARYFVTQMLNDEKYLYSQRERRNNIVALVKAKVEHGSLKKIYRLKDKFYAW